MQNFFTPIQVIRKHSLCYLPQELLRFKEEQLFQITQPRIPSLADERRQVISWLRTIPLFMRQQAAALHSAEFVTLVRKLYQQSQTCEQPFKYSFSLVEGQFRIQRQRFYKQNRELQRSLLLDVRLISQGQLFEALTLAESSFAEPQALLDLFDRVLGGVFLDTSHFSEEQLKIGRVKFEAEAFDVQSKTIGVWIAQLLLKQILLSFATGGRGVETTCKHIKQQEQQYSKLWKELQPNQRIKLVEKGFLKSIEEMMDDYRASVGVDWHELPKLYIIKSREEVIKDYSEVNSKQLYNRLIFSTLQESLNLFQIFKIEISLEIQTYLTNLKSGAKKQKKKKKRNIDHLPTTLPITPKVNPTVELKAKTAVKVEKNSTEQSQKSQRNTHKDSSIIRQDSKIEQAQSIEKEVNQSLEKDQNQTSQNIIDTYAKRLKQRNRDKYRKIILNRLTIILGQYNLVCRPYGSFAVHLSLPDSDLDIQVDSSLLGYFYLDYLSQRKQVIAALDFLQKIFESQDWISETSLFHNARIPLLTFKADAGMHYENPTSLKTRLRLNGKSFPKGEVTLQVDISIQPYANMTEIPHNGLESTEMIREWVENMPYFERLVLSFKSIVRKANLHKSYEGGISSYCLILLTVAFLKIEMPDESSSDNLFEKLVAFIKRFYELHLIVDITSEEIISQGGQAPVLVSPWDKRNLIERSFRFGQMISALNNWKAMLRE